MLTREMGAVKVKAMGQYIPIPQKKRKQQSPAAVTERLNYPTVESYLEEVVSPVQDGNI